jgi:hypothetical protein
LAKVACVVVVIMFLALPLLPPASGVGHLQISNSVPEYKQTLNTHSQIESLLYQIDGRLVEKYIQKLQDFKTRYSYRGDKCYLASEYIASVFQQNGLTVSYDDFVYQAVKMRNVVGEKTGTVTPESIYIISAHYDSTTYSYSWDQAPGADDNGSGTAAVMALAETLSDYDFNCTIRFIAFCGEEQGLRGSYHYLIDLLTANESVSGIMNMDMIAHNPNPGVHLVKLYTGSGTDIVDPVPLINEIVNTTIEYLDIIGLQIQYAGQSGSSDHHTFARFYKSILLIENNFSPYYHYPTDTIDKLNFTYCANVTQITLATIAKLAQIIPGDNSPPAMTAGFPRDGSYAVALPEISIQVTDPSGLNLTSLVMLVDGSIISPALTAISQGYNVSYVPAVPFSDSQVISVSVQSEDNFGSASAAFWNFTVDAMPPEPPTNFTIIQSQIEFQKQGLAINVGSTYDSKYAQKPSVIYHDGEYKMWYAGYDGSRYKICYANSSDGLSWVKYGIVLSIGIAGSPDSTYAGYPSVIFDGEYKMWYSGHSGTNWRIMYANSSDGLSWVKQGVVLDLGVSGAMDDTHAYFPCVLKTDEYEMWYAGYDGLKYRILYANSTNGLNWTKLGREILLQGSGCVFGDAYVTEPAVAYHLGEYHMLFGRFDGQKMRSIYAKSHDGLIWNEIGMALDAGAPSDYDSLRAIQCSIIMSDNETKVWYSGYNNINLRIMFAKMTGDMLLTDITLTWNSSSSPDLAHYEVFRETRPSAFRYPLERVNPEYYTPPTGLTPWTYQNERQYNISVYGPVSGSDPPFFYLPDDSIKDIDIYLKNSAGGWTKLASGTDYAVDTVIGHVEISSGLFSAGCELFACYNHSAGKAMRVIGNSLADVRAGSDSNKSYYYFIRAVDRAGNYAYSANMAAKIGTVVTTSWNLLCNPFLQGQVPVSEALAGLRWTAARTWDPAKWPNHWTSNVPWRSESVNTLQTLDSSMGVWVKASAPGAYAATGQASNLSINLVAGWNLVIYPYYEIMSVSQALAGIPWDSVASFNSAFPNQLDELTANDWLEPGHGFWVRVTSDAVWNAVNVP